SSLNCFTNSFIRFKKRSTIQSKTKRLGASNTKRPSAYSACKGRIQVLNCWDGNSPSRELKHLSQSEELKSNSPNYFYGVRVCRDSAPRSKRVAFVPGYISRVRT